MEKECRCEIEECHVCMDKFKTEFEGVAFCAPCELHYMEDDGRMDAMEGEHEN